MRFKNLFYLGETSENINVHRNYPYFAKGEDFDPGAKIINQ